MDDINKNLNEEQKRSIDNQDVTKTTESPVENVIDAQVLESESIEIPEQTVQDNLEPIINQGEVIGAERQERLTEREKARQAKLEADKQVQNQESIVRALGQETLGRGQAEAQALANAGISETQQEIDALDSAILASSRALKQARVKDEQDVNALAGRGRAVPASVVRGRQALLQSQRLAERKLDAIDLENDIATSQLLQGKVDGARKAIERAVALKYEDKKAELQLEKEWLSRTDSKLAEAKQKELKAIEKEEQEEQNIFDIAEQARKDGAGASEIKAILSSTNRNEALNNAPSLGQSARLDNQLKLMDINSKSLDIKMQRKKLAELENPKSGLDIKPDFTAATYAKRMKDAASIIDENERGLGQKVLSIATFGISNVNKRQKRNQAERNFVNAILRQESGAQIADSEFESAAKQYFPDSADTKETREQKRKNREVVIQGMILESGGAYEVLEETIEGEDPDSFLNSFDFDEAPEDFFNDL